MKKFDPNNFIKPTQAELKNKLNPLQYEVTQKEATEPPFQNEYWNQDKDGLYVDIISGEPLFCSLDKFDSGCGWPSFQSAIKENINTKPDFKLMQQRIEIRSKYADSHLGHVFNDGPKPSGLRYCLNSAAVRFIPKEKLEEEGYADYIHLFYETAILAGGCFWGMEDLFRQLPGVVETTVGYTGGSNSHPSYNTVKTGSTGHAEAIQIKFEKSQNNYEKILRFFFKMHDPTTENQQGNDLGSQYRSAIFYLNGEQEKIAEKIIRLANDSGLWPSPIVTQLIAAKEFYPAEDYHQDYLEKNPNGYTCHFIRPIDF